ncbi:beta-galactosidase [bacterium]|nr:beta-galactosidase [bacterium]
MKNFAFPRQVKNLLIPFLCDLLLAQPFNVDYPIGFVSHYPLIVHQDEQIPRIGANVCIVRAPWALIEPEEDKWDFSLLDRQLEWAKETGIKLVYLMEAGPAHAAGVRWLVEKLKSQGETMCSAKGDIIDDPSYQSETYRSYLSRFIRNTIGYLSHHKYAEYIYGYSNGCEWWHPILYSYSKCDKNGFREWLRNKYPSLKALNDSWGTGFKDWQEIQPPTLYPLGVGREPQGCFMPASAYSDICWATNEESHINVKPGEKLTFYLELSTENLIGEVFLEVAWLSKDNPKPFKSDWSPPFIQSNGRGIIKFSLTVPSSSAKAWLLMKLMGTGKVVFQSIRIFDEEGNDVAPNPFLDPALGKWVFIAWSVEQSENLSHQWKSRGEMSITYQPKISLEGNPEFPLAMIDDWFNYRFENFAQFIDWMAEECQIADPNRPVLSYLTFAFANPFEWDYAQDVAIALDYWVENAKHQTILGMQINSAEGDFDSLTAAIDSVRRYGKPIWAIDLLDFTKGTYLGEDGLTRTSLSVLQHSGSESGIQYYCWYGTPDYNYSELGIDSLKRMIDRVKKTASLLKGFKPICEVALVQPRMPLYPYLPQPPNDYADFMGWYKLLVRAGICPDIYTIHALEKADLSLYKAVIIPDCAYITYKALEALRKASLAGVKLISSGRFALYDMTGRKIEPSSLPKLSHRFEESIGRESLGEVFRLKDKGNTPPRLICTQSFPSVPLPKLDKLLKILKNSGVNVLCHPMKDAQLTLVPFKKNEHSIVFALPQFDWTGEVSIEGRYFRIDKLGSLLNIRQERK